MYGKAQQGRLSLQLDERLAAAVMLVTMYGKAQQGRLSLQLDERLDSSLGGDW
jgi:hypothetical protein